ncbi:hypothetical protein NQ317_006036 [Molorchus minor]|uniref:thioredoxin-dependent peroxiredoxin n=1 Tax=Molorchus minor TaxID=1323400 RepID=A0ABQ9K2K3_9CUCU|nr:hypothetical protein NQ317_006036 [Molorchus minor]
MTNLRLGDTIPNFDADTTKGKINLYKWQDNMWVVLFSHPKDFTPICTSELSKIADQEPFFRKLNVKFLAHSCDSLPEHLAWEKDILSQCWDSPTSELPFPIVADGDRRLAKLLDMFDADNCKKNLGLTTRTLYIIDPGHKLRFALHYPVTVGRNTHQTMDREILRIIESLQLTDRIPQVETPVNWKVGDKVLIKSDVPEHQLSKIFCKGTQIEYIMAKGTIRTTKEY